MPPSPTLTGACTPGTLSPAACVQGGGAGNVEYVDTLRLDDVIKEKVWLMKLDVEGCECHCLKSGDALFASGNGPNYVFIETDRVRVRRRAVGVVCCCCCCRAGGELLGMPTFVAPPPRAGERL